MIMMVKITTQHKRWLVIMLLALPLTLPLMGCSSKLRLPWEPDPLDSSRVVTREPLEIPPNLDVLPTPATEGERPAIERSKELSREQQGQLPQWMRNSKQQSGQTQQQ